MRPLTSLSSAAFAATLLAACQAGDGGTASGPIDAYSDIKAEDTVKFTGTEPFWGGEVAGGQLLYSTPENMDGDRIAVERFAGNSGVSYTGSLGGNRFDMMVTEGDCSDGMSDRTYPFTVTLMIGEEQRRGCAWTEARPFTGPANP